MTLLQPIVWWILVQTLALAVLPLAGAAGRTLPGRGYALAKPLGVLLSAWLFWLGVSAGALPNDGRGAVVAVLLMAVVAWGLRWRDVLPAPSLPDRRLVAAVEVAWTAAFVLALVLRAGDAAILGGEKPSEFAMLNATMSAPSYPPADPWLAGHALNYYYLGYVVVAHLAHLAGTTAGVAFTLGIPLVMGLAVSAALGIGYDLTALAPARPGEDDGAAPEPVGGANVREPRPGHPVAVGTAGALVLLAGNLEVAVEGVRAVSGSAGRALGRWLGMSAYEPAFHQDFWFPDAWWRRAALVLKDEGLAGDLRPLSTEFPFYDVMLGDLHAPILTLPFALLAVWLALAVFRDRREGDGFGIPLSFSLLALSAGALWAGNAWFLPSLLLLGAVAMGLPDRPATGPGGRGARGVRTGARIARAGVAQGGWTLARVLAAGAALAVAAWLLYLPFHLHYDAPVQGLEWVLFEGTTLRQLLVAVGPLLAGTAVVLALASSDARRAGARIGRPVAWLTGVLVAMAAAWLAGVLALRLAGAAEEQGLDYASLLLANLGELIARRALGGPALLLLAAGVAWVVVVGRRAVAAGREAEGAGAGSAEGTGRAFAVTLAGVGLLTLLVPEVVYFDDGQGWRYNMVLKLHFVAWVLLAPVVGWGVVAAVRMGRSRGPALRTLSWTALAAVTVAATYPVAASVHRVGEAEWALDGAAGARTRYAADARAMAWLCASAPAGAVITEAVGQAFSDGGRISAATGLPTVLGWPGHQRTYRGPGIWPEVQRRRADVARIYQTADRVELAGLLERYGVSLVYLGPLERAAYPGAGESAAASLPVEYDDGVVRILRGPAPAAGPPLACRPGR